MQKKFGKDYFLVSSINYGRNFQIMSKTHGVFFNEESQTYKIFTDAILEPSLALSNALEPALEPTL